MLLKAKMEFISVVQEWQPSTEVVTVQHIVYAFHLRLLNLLPLKKPVWSRYSGLLFNSVWYIYIPQHNIVISKLNDLWLWTEAIKNPLYSLSTSSWKAAAQIALPFSLSLSVYEVWLLNNGTFIRPAQLLNSHCESN